ncbi:uncharacterized protein MONBRDRAFT_38106 [Monosiga brevicollis MX1]|uniref:Glutathione transferase n=1 Tax=Monosiga brevicollis TaxID=81824 RepID=A9V5Q1_MONBE|nr:uncharacterized protein MONBRDRAFT_38106 [Monosiga brevicollis MX1]EDQ87155.1 predicted protein [Monosiga brevicollis MX1]|eukprot:XP_001748098.1 hypothetical protein [Monosiga brevicollis MX1]
MASSDILYGFDNHPRTEVVLVAAKFAQKEVELRSKHPEFDFPAALHTPEFQQRFPLQTVPALVTEHGEPIFGELAIATYYAALNNKCLLPERAYDQGLVQQFLTLTQLELFPALSAWMFPIQGYLPYDAEDVARSRGEADRILKYLNDLLSERTFLCANRMTLADVVIGCHLRPLFQQFLDASARASLAHLTAWFERLIARPEFQDVVGAVTFCETPLAYDDNRASELQEQPDASPVMILATNELQLETWSHDQQIDLLGHHPARNWHFPHFLSDVFWLFNLEALMTEASQDHAIHYSCQKGNDNAPCTAATRTLMMLNLGVNLCKTGRRDAALHVLLVERANADGRAFVNGDRLAANLYSSLADATMRQDVRIDRVNFDNMTIDAQQAAVQASGQTSDPPRLLEDLLPPGRACFY